MKIFKKKVRPFKVLPKGMSYPTGVFVETDNHTYYIKGENKYRLHSKKMLDTWAPPAVAKASEQLLSDYKLVGHIGFRNGTLIKNMYDGRTYLISGNKKCRVANPDWLDYLGYEDAILVSNHETNFHPDGETLN